MKSLREKMKAGLVSKLEYRKQVLDTTLEILKSAECDFVKSLGEGSFGTVVELEYTPLRVPFAVKIVLQEYACIGEVRHWPSLKHENILPLLAWRHFSMASSYVFIMPRYASAVDIRLEAPEFRMDRQALQKSVTWLRDVLRGLQYLHRQGLFHLDVKCNNVLLVEDDSRAVLCDFGFVRSAPEGKVDSYGSPFIFRPPEAHDGRSWSDFTSDVVPVEPIKFDVWTVGIMALEMFTSLGLTRSALRWHDPRWPVEIYTAVYALLKVKNFRMLLRETFPASDISSSQAAAIREFIVGCLRLHPCQRPATDEALEHVLFGGDQTFPDPKNSVWSTLASPAKIEFLVGVYNGRAFQRPVQQPMVEKQVVVEPPASERQLQLSEGEIPLHRMQAPKKRGTRKYFRGLVQACFPMFFRSRESDE